MAYDYVTPTGLIVPDTDNIKAEVEAEWKAAFGEDFIVAEQTDQGVMIAAEVEARDGVVRYNAAVANQINPNYASGVFIDALWALTGGSRRGATRSIQRGLVLTGQPGTIIPAGSLVGVTGTENLFATLSAVILDSSGSGTTDAQAQQTGQIAAAATTMTRIVTGVLGWETVNNPTDAEVGRPIESDVASRRRRRQTLALQGISTVEGVVSHLYDVEGVRSLAFRENVKSTTQVIDGITLTAHSVWACVDGGSDADIAMALLSTKTFGAGWNGAVVVPTVEPASGQTYDVQLDRPVKVPVFIRVTARFNGTDGFAIIPKAVMSYRDGELEGDAGFVVGADISPYEIGGAVNQVEPFIFVTKVELSTDSGTTWSTNELSIALDHQASVTDSSIIVVPV